MSTWDMARLASKRPLRKPYKPVGPVGVRAPRTADSLAPACPGCGYHVCSCPKPAYIEPWLSGNVRGYGQTDRDVPIQFDTYVKPGVWAYIENPETRDVIRCGLLTQEQLAELYEFRKEDHKPSAPARAPVPPVGGLTYQPLRDRVYTYPPAPLPEHDTIPELPGTPTYDIRADVPSAARERLMKGILTGDFSKI